MDNLYDLIVGQWFWVLLFLVLLTPAVYELGFVPWFKNPKVLSPKWVKLKTLGVRDVYFRKSDTEKQRYWIRVKGVDDRHVEVQIGPNRKGEPPWIFTGVEEKADPNELVSFFCKPPNSEK